MQPWEVSGWEHFKNGVLMTVIVLAFLAALALLAIAWSGGETGCGWLGSAPRRQCAHHPHRHHLQSENRGQKLN